MTEQNFYPLNVFMFHSPINCTLTAAAHNVDTDVGRAKEELNHRVVVLPHSPDQPCHTTSIPCVDIGAALQGSFHPFQVTILAKINQRQARLPQMDMPSPRPSRERLPKLVRHAGPRASALSHWQLTHWEACTVWLSSR